MKQTFIGTVFLLLFSCGGGNTNEKDVSDAIEGVKDIMSSSANISERQQELKIMEPLPAEAFKQWAQDAVLGLSKKESTERLLKFEDYNYSGYSTYYKGDGKSIQLEIFDGAGSTVYSRYAGMLSTDAMNQERENYYEKNVERDGIMVNEWFDSKRNDCSLLFIIDNRFVVNIKASGFSPDEVWNNLSDFKLDELN